MMAEKDEARTELLDRMLGAGTFRDAEAVEGLADLWLEENPGDSRVLAAQQRLEKRVARVRDPEREADRATLMVFIVAFSAAASVVFLLTGMLYAALVAALIVAFGFPWEVVGEGVAELRGGPGGIEPRRENGER